MRLFKRKLRKDSRGLSMVELICAVAILGAISTAIGGAMLVSANSYKRGTEEAELQKSSEFAANVIEGLIVDATNEVNFVGGTLTITNVDCTYTVRYDSGDHRLYYSELPVGGVASGETVLAENVTNFQADAGDFKTSRKLNITLGMTNPSGRSISTVYNIMSRNNPTSSTLVAVPGSAIIDVNGEITLEPNQVYVLPIAVYTSGSAIGGFDAALAPEDDSTTGLLEVNADSVKIKIGKNEKGGADGKLNLVLTTKAVDPSTSPSIPYDSRTVSVNIRRVLDLDMELKKTSGNMYMAGSVYQVTKHDAEPKFVKGTNLDQVPGAVYDTDYVNPYGATWWVEMGGASGTTYNVNEYVEQVARVDDVTPYYSFRLKQDLPPGVTLMVWSQAKHPDGTISGVATNKTGLVYDTVKNHVDLKRSGWYNYNYGDFLRGDDNQISIGMNFSWPSSGWSTCTRNFICRKVKVDSTGNVTEAIGDWSDPTPVGDNGTGGMFMRPGSMTKYLDPSFAYQIQVMTEFFDGSGNRVWPSDTIENSMEQYIFDFTIPEVSLMMGNYNFAGQTGTVTAGNKTGWGYDDRIVVNGINGTNRIEFDIAAAHASKLCNTDLKVVVYKEVGAAWVPVSQPSITPEYADRAKGYLKFEIQNNAEQKGIFKAEMKWKDGSDLYTWFGSDLSYTVEDSNRGYLYFELR